MRTPAEVLDAYGTWIASLAPWTHFVTLTHRLPDSSDANRARHYTRVGFSRHRRLVREWFHAVVRPRDAAARWWSELELHESGIPTNTDYSRLLVTPRRCRFGRHGGILRVMRASTGSRIRRPWLAT